MFRASAFFVNSGEVFGVVLAHSEFPFSEIDDFRTNALLGYARLSSLKPQEAYRRSLLVSVQIQGVQIFGISVTKAKLGRVPTWYDKNLIKTRLEGIERKKLIHIFTLDEKFQY